MPELPEVETIKRELEPLITGQKIKECVVLRKDVIAFPSFQNFRRSLLNNKITNVKRIAKYLIIELDPDRSLIFHLRLSGALIVRPLNTGFERFTRLALKLDKCWLLFVEPRVLGRVYLLNSNDKPACLKGFYRLSPEPLSRAFSKRYFQNQIKKRKAIIKAILLNQDICAGVGNIYSDEALFRAGIRPTRRANNLTYDEIEKLRIALRSVLRDGIKHLGTSVSDYRRTDGKKGNFQKMLFAYGREGEPCRRCGSEIQLKKIGNRGTRYCPRCQK
ncbi:DNA-formamidopyrimidine glycosylase [candidate division WOR-3 bacterium RBG_13_43_14]|uniref:DNA-formamidopyrimidine glycosylase n=1 Tax=candidate division WOR-3 bacterium RBG_13_43_14 TaxID=1802590 RepID=A0A1F4UEB2_UNCW3|nr:MAG: DNA-formamidopyrimidine glycosylase [candidate division WOR-3 bacterium RBG_13_43_14]